MNVKIISILLLIILIGTFAAERVYRKIERSQRMEQFRDLPKPEKKWVYFHPFIAKRVFEISKEVKKYADSKKVRNSLDGDIDGGQADAFRHTLWMARISRDFGKRAAISLGKAHEDANYLHYLEKRLEDGSVPDHQGSLMDLANNRVGAELGRKHRDASDSELVEIAKSAVLDGRCWVLKKNKKGRYLDSDGEIIPRDSLNGRWETAKVLVRSNKSRMAD